MMTAGGYVAADHFTDRRQAHQVPRVSRGIKVTKAIGEMPVQRELPEIRVTPGLRVRPEPRATPVQLEQPANKVRRGERERPGATQK
jgi:hypothetical protein